MALEQPPLFIYPRSIGKRFLKNQGEISDEKLQLGIDFCKKYLKQEEKICKEMKDYWIFLSQRTPAKLRKEFKKMLLANIYNEIQDKRDSVSRLLFEQKELQKEAMELEEELKRLTE